MDLFYSYRWHQKPTDDSKTREKVESIVGEFAVDIDTIIQQLRSLEEVDLSVKNSTIQSLKKIQKANWNYAIEHDKITFETEMTQIENAFKSIVRLFKDNKIPMKPIDTESVDGFIRDIIRRCIGKLLQNRGPYFAKSAPDDDLQRTEFIKSRHLMTSRKNRNLYSVHTERSWFAMFILGDFVHFFGKEEQPYDVKLDAGRDVFKQQFVHVFNRYCLTLNTDHVPFTLNSSYTVSSALHWHALDRLATLVAQFHASIH